MNATWPKYPAYDKGPHLEEAALLEFSQRPVTGWEIFDFPWTPFLNGAWRPQFHVTPRLTKSHFSVATHDDAPGPFPFGEARLYNGGGRSGTGIPIPLVAASPPPVKPRGLDERTMLFSFHGANTHPLRQEMPDAVRKLCRKSPVYLKRWTPEVSRNDVLEMFTALSKSQFALAPRGYGPTSYRLYEAMRLGVVPVYVSDVHWLPPMVPWHLCAIVASSWTEAMERMMDLQGSPAWAEMSVQCQVHAPTVASTLEWIRKDLVSNS